MRLHLSVCEVQVSPRSARGKSLGLWRWARSPTMGKKGQKTHYLPSGARSLIVSRAHLRSLYSSRARNKSRTYIIGAQDYRPQKWPKVSADGERGKSLGLWRWARSLTMGRKGQKSHSIPKDGRVSADARGARVSHGRRAPTHGRAEDGR